MRYEVRSGIGAGRKYHVQDMHGSRDIIASDRTRAEAEIIAFALNVIADGYELSAEHPVTRNGWSFNPNAIRTYNGPTDGVKV